MNLESMNVNIRLAGARDEHVLLHIIRASFRDGAERFGLTIVNCPTHPAFIGPRQVRQLLADHLVYLLEVEGSAVGTVTLADKGGQVMELRRLAVLPEQRGRGWGRRLVTHALQEAEKAGATRVQLDIIAANIPLEKWYQEQGFVPLPFTHPAGVPFVVRPMMRPLGAPTPAAIV